MKVTNWARIFLNGASFITYLFLISFIRSYLNYLFLFAKLELYSWRQKDNVVDRQSIKQINCKSTKHITERKMKEIHIYVPDFVLTLSNQ